MGEKVKTCQEPPEPLIVLQAARFELPALHAATVGYIRLLEMSVIVPGCFCDEIVISPSSQEALFVYNREPARASL